MKISPTSTLAIATLASALCVQTANAVPLVYNCRVFDYSEAGVETAEFSYGQQGKRLRFESRLSEVGIYLDKDHHLELSLRPRYSTVEPKPYARTTGYSTPHRIAVTFSGGSSYASRVDCQL